MGDRWSQEELYNVIGEPWNMKGVPQDRVVAEKRKYTTKQLIDKHGKTKGCQSCSGNSTVHSARCRARFEAIFANEEKEMKLRGVLVPPVSSTKPSADADKAVPETVEQQMDRKKDQKDKENEVQGPTRSEVATPAANASTAESMDAEETLGDEAIQPSDVRRRRISQKRPYQQALDDMDPGFTDETQSSKKGRLVNALVMPTLDLPNCEAWAQAQMEQYELTEQVQDLERMISELTEAGVEQYRADLERDGNETKENLDWVRFELVTEPGPIYGHLSGQPLCKVKVAIGRTTEVQRMDEFTVYAEVDEKEAVGRKKIRSKWLDDNKGDAVRSRLVAQEVGYTKREDTFAATPPLKGIGIIISLCASKPPRAARCIGRWDISVAFFHAEIVDDLHVVPPPGLRKPGKIWQLSRAMYGTREASKLFQDEVKRVLAEKGNYVQIEVTPSIYYSEKYDTELLVHGDDFLADGTNDGLDVLDCLLHENSTCKTLDRIGPGHATEGAFVGRMIRYHEGLGFEYEAGRKHVPKMLRILGADMSKTKPAETPGSNDTGKTAGNALDYLDENGALGFKQCAGTALYFVLDRVGAKFACKTVMKGMAKPRELDPMRLKRLVRFFIKKPYQTYKFKFQNLPSKLTGIVDGDWAGCKETRYSSRGGIEMSCDHMLNDYSVAQQFIAPSTAESEWYAMITGAGHLLLTRNILRAMEIEVGLELHTDSSAAKGTSARQGVGKLRHMEAKMLWLQQYTKRRDIAVRKIDGAENVGDLGTKNLDANRIEYLLGKLPYGDPWGSGTSSMAMLVAGAIAMRGLGFPLRTGLAWMWLLTLPLASGLPGWVKSALDVIQGIIGTMVELTDEQHELNWLFLLTYVVMLASTILLIVQWKYFGLGPRGTQTIYAPAETVPELAPSPITPVVPMSPVTVNVTTSSGSGGGRNAPILDDPEPAFASGTVPNYAAQLSAADFHGGNDCTRMKVVVLQSALRTCKLPGSGTKADLINRLKSFAENEKEITPMQNEFLQDLWA